MMKVARRRFFGVLGGGALAGRQVAEQAARSLAGIGQGSGFPGVDLRDALRSDRGSGGGGGIAVPTSNPAGTNWQIARDIRDNLIQKALDTPARRAELEAILYEQHRSVYTLDSDLASNRSYSLAAKLCYQRQRNVAREIAYSVQEKSIYQRVNDWRDRVLSLAGIKF